MPSEIFSGAPPNHKHDGADITTGTVAKERIEHHASLHQNGGADEISVAGLSGELADGQPPKSHASSHQNGGADEISVAGLSGELADRQKPKITERADPSCANLSTYELCWDSINIRLIYKDSGGTCHYWTRTGELV